VSTRTAQAGTFSRLMLTVAAVSAIALSMIWLAGPVLATHVTPTFVAGNHTCAQLDSEFGHEFKIQPVESGTFDDPNSDFSVTLTVNDTAAGPTVDFVSNLAVDAVFVKGGDDGNLYSYDPAETADTGLHAPLNPNGKWAGLSHLSFCFTTTPEESVPESAPESAPESVPGSVSESAPESEEQSVAESGEQSVRISTGTPEESAPDGALSLNGVGALLTIAFSLILLASLGALAYANVKSVRS
jgi:hypothetical protein